MRLAAAVTRPAGLPIKSLSGAVLWLAVFLGGFVFVEPAPYDLFIAVVIPSWALFGLQIPRAVSPLLILMMLFLAGGVLAASQATHLDEQPMYMAVSGFLAVSACFYASLVGQSERRLQTIVGAWICAALATAALGLLGYFGLTGEWFVKFGRASGGFQDPNVFGPFLIFPFLMLIHRALTGRFASAVLSGGLALVLLAAIFLSFSRAAWGLALLCPMLLAVILIATERNPSAQARYIGVGVVGVVLIAVLLAAALSIPAVADLFQERAQVVQDYDSGRFGRFQRYVVGFNLMLDHPLGIGAMEFGKRYGEDEHDIWLKSLTTYGWLGFAAFATLVVWTLSAAFPLLFRSGPMQAVAQAAYIVFLGHIIIATVIDIDHWRHVYLLLGILWGAIAADRRAAQERLARAYPGPLRMSSPPGLRA